MHYLEKRPVRLQSVIYPLGLMAAALLLQACASTPRLGHSVGISIPNQIPTQNQAALRRINIPDVRQDPKEALREQCPKVIAWMKDAHFSDEPERQAPGTTYESLDRDNVNLIQEPYFSSYFGKPYFELSTAELGTYNRYFFNRCLMQVPGQVSVRRQTAGTRVFTVGQAYNAKLMAKAQSESQKLEKNVAILDALQPTDADYDQLLQMQLSAGEAVKNSGTPGETTYFAAIRRAEDRVAIPVEARRVEAALTGVHDDSRLSEYSALRKRLEDGAGSAALNTARQANLAKVKAVQREILASDASQERPKIDALGSGLAGLKAGASWEDSFLSKYGDSVRKSDELTAVLTYYRQRRNTTMIAYKPTFFASLQSSRNPRVVAAEIMRDDDKYSPIGREYQAAVDALIAPFNGFSNSDYLNAIYNHDLAEVSRLDAKYMAGQRAMMDATGASRGPFGTLINGMMSKGSFIMVVLRTYIEEYGDHYASCLRRDAVEFTVRTTRTRGYSVETSDKAVRVNKEFGAVYEALGPDQEPTGATVIGDLLTGSSLIKMISGTESLMSSFNCADAKIKTFEEGMLAVYAAH